MPLGMGPEVAMSRWSTWGNDALPEYDESDRYSDRRSRGCSPTHGDPCGECASCGGEEPTDDDSADDSAEGEE